MTNTIEQNSVHEIVTAEESDWETLRNLKLEALSREPQAYWKTASELGEDLERTPEQWQAEIADKNARFIVLMVDGEAQGFSSVTYSPRKKTATNNSIYIREDARGNGYGKEMIAKREEIVRSDFPEAESVKAHILSHSEAALQLYTESGYEADETKLIFKKRFAQPFGELVLRKEIES